MFGKRAVDLVKELVAAGPNALPPYNVMIPLPSSDSPALFILDLTDKRNIMTTVTAGMRAWAIFVQIKSELCIKIILQHSMPYVGRMHEFHECILQDEQVRLVLEEVAEHSATLKELSG